MKSAYGECLNVSYNNIKYMKKFQICKQNETGCMMKNNLVEGEW